MKILGFFLVFIACTYPAYADDTVYAVNICSSSTGTMITDGIRGSMVVNVQGATSICVAAIGDCSLLTECIGAPLATDTAASFSGKLDGSRRYCGILKSGSTCSRVGVNLKDEN